MSITYPLTIPSSPAPSKMHFAPRFAVGQSESLFTYQSEFFEHQGQQWVVDVNLPPMRQDQAELWVAWGLALNGTLGTFYMGDRAGKTARGTVSGTPLVRGAGQQRSKFLSTKGWTPGSQILKAGDYLQVGYRLYKSLVTVTADGSGYSDIDIFPRVRDVLTDNQSIIVANTIGTWRLKNPIEWDIEEAKIYGISFTAVEAL